MIIAVRTVLIRVFILGEIFAKGFTALFTDECHLDRFAKDMILRFGMTLRALCKA